MRRKRNRRSIRLRGHDYSLAGHYYVTVCVKNRQSILGDVCHGKMILNAMGEKVQFTWLDLPRHNKNIELDEFIVMPNHLHGIIIIVGAGSKPAQKHRHISIGNYKRAGLEPAPTDHGLSEIVRQFKTFSTKRINQINNTLGVSIWQRNYYDHIIRNNASLQKIREYIINNPLTWPYDAENQHRIAGGSF